MKLRPYQQAAYDAVLAEYAKGVVSTLALMPTGTGKTVLFAHLANHFKQFGRVLVIAHRTELIEQAAVKILAVTGHEAEIEKAEQWAQCDGGLGWASPFIASSVQTQVSGKKEKRRMTRFRPEHFSLLILDEGHHGAADSYREVVAHYRQNPKLVVLGVTATGDRADGIGLSEVFDSVAYNYEMPAAINDGWLVPVRQRSVFVEGLDFSRCRTTAGDLNKGDVATELEKRVHPMVQPTIEICCGLPKGTLESIRDDEGRVDKLREMMEGRRPRKTLIFCISVKQAEKMAEIINRWLPSSAKFVCGETPEDERREMFADYAAGKFPFLVNCGVATEGFDEPSIEVVVMGRPTKSRALAIQMIGRGTRPLTEIANILGDLPEAESRRMLIEGSDKPSVEILDFVGNCGKHQLVTAIDVLVGEGVDPDTLRRAKKIMEEEAIEPGKAVEKAKQQKLIEDENKREQRRKQQERERVEAEKRRDIVATTNYDVQEVDGFTPAYESAIKRGIPDKQLKIFDKAKLKDEEIAALSPEGAKALSREIVRHWSLNLCSYRQAKTLGKYGYTRMELHDMPFDEAHEKIDAIARNGWKRPDENVA